MFQNVNVAKSAPFALLTIYQKKSLYPPKVFKIAPVLANYAKSTQFLLNHINPCSPTVPQPFYSKSREIRSIRKYSERMTRN